MPAKPNVHEGRARFPCRTEGLLFVERGIELYQHELHQEQQLRLLQKKLKLWDWNSYQLAVISSLYVPP
ncbi:MAG: hypothetical protein FJ215_09935 [Ignavibacteria bacterium]|nr:hypothetical protein [Ignavibacteria bacterium]